ncbi:MAG TPA: TIM barrel protein [Gemmatimonadaceae bacterium]|nr:TIM barrel protein [Gemmatimonadaceae bacterium]
MSSLDESRAAPQTGIDRRQLLGVAAASAVAWALPGCRPSGAQASGAKGEVTEGAIDRSRRGLMMYSARGLIMNDKLNYPTLPSGFRDVFEMAAAIGYTGIELFSFTGAPSFTQAPGAEGGAHPSAAQVRKWLDQAGLKAIGHYNAAVANNAAVGLTPATVDAALETAAILGQPHTGSHDATDTLRQKKDVDVVIESWNKMAVNASRAGIPIYTHAHDAPWNFLLDTGPVDAKGNYARSSGIRVMDYFLTHTDAKWIKCEMDVFWAHVAQFRYSSYLTADGKTVTDVFQPAHQVAKDPSRYPILHAKDGIKAPKTEAGWSICPFGQGDIDYQGFIKAAQLDKPNPWWSCEQDNADGGEGDPQKAVRDIATAYRGF